PAPRLLLYGESPAARALAQLGKAMGYRIEVGGTQPAVPARGTEKLFAVVATMGESDEDSVAAALAARPAYLGVVASRKRFAPRHGSSSTANRRLPGRSRSSARRWVTGSRWAAPSLPSRPAGPSSCSPWSRRWERATRTRSPPRSPPGPPTWAWSRAASASPSS